MRFGRGRHGNQEPKKSLFLKVRDAQNSIAKGEEFWKGFKRGAKSPRRVNKNSPNNPVRKKLTGVGRRRSETRSHLEHPISMIAVKLGSSVRGVSNQCARKRGGAKGVADSGRRMCSGALKSEEKTGGACLEGARLKDFFPSRGDLHRQKNVGELPSDKRGITFPQEKNRKGQKWGGPKVES